MSVGSVQVATFSVYLGHLSPQFGTLQQESCVFLSLRPFSQNFICRCIGINGTFRIPIPPEDASIFLQQLHMQVAVAQGRRFGRDFHQLLFQNVGSLFKLRQAQKMVRRDHDFLRRECQPRHEVQRLRAGLRIHRVWRGGGLGSWCHLSLGFGRCLGGQFEATPHTHCTDFRCHGCHGGRPLLWRCLGNRFDFLGIGGTRWFWG
mmetsp:Transcript_46523/g.101245  ORF Transcript_46523/g.101245 Transcript_46523/m.101245 type:complete len:204 (+) Transcript_46523:204-815(+)